MERKSSIHCIYECKEVTWKKIDFIKLYDFILSDVFFLSKKIVSVPPPYLSQGINFFNKVKFQYNFVSEVKKIIKLDSKKHYYGTIISSILIAHKNTVKYTLIEEGMGSLLYRNNSSEKFLKSILKNILFKFHFPRKSKYITLTSDPHTAVIRRLDFRNYHSQIVESSLSKLIDIGKSYNSSILVLVINDSYGLNGHPKTPKKLSKKYVELNFQIIKSFVNKYCLENRPLLMLKSHPVLSNDGDLLSPLTEKLSENGINSIDILSKINFSQKSSIPAEIFIKYIKFDFILAADISSTIWNVCHNTKAKIILPIKDIKKLMNDEQSIHLKLYEKQIFINNILGNRVIFI